MAIVIFLIVVGILYSIELAYYTRKGLSKVDVDIHFSQNIANCGDIIEVVEVVQNNKRIPLPFLILKYETPVAITFNDMTNVSLTDNYYREDMLSMGAFTRHTRKIKVTCTKRGYYTFTRITASSSDLFLFQKIGMMVDSKSSVTVLPEVLSGEELNSLLTITFSEIQRRRTLLTDPFTLAGIREYQEWDPMRAVNWMASARTGDLMVNQNASANQNKINLFLNLEHYNHKNSDGLLEKSISIAYTCMMKLYEQGTSVAFYSNGVDVVTNRPVVDKTSNISSMEQRGIDLARIDLTKDVIPFIELVDEYIMHNSSDELNVIISANHDDEYRRIVENIINSGKNVLWIMPCYKDDHRASNFNVESTIAPYFKRMEVQGHE